MRALCNKMWTLRIMFATGVVLLACSGFVVHAGQTEPVGIENVTASPQAQPNEPAKTSLAPTPIDPAPIDIPVAPQVPQYGTDPLLGLVPLNEFAPRPYAPDALDAPDASGLRSVEECCRIGTTSQQPALSRFFHGNMIEITEEAVLTEMRVELDFNFQADLTFVVYRLNQGATEFTPIFVQPTTQNGVGLGLYPVDLVVPLTLTPNMNAGVPVATLFLVGIGWDEAQSIAFSRDTVNGAQSFCRGEALGYWGLGQAPPAPPLGTIPDLDVSIFSGAVLVMDLCFEIPPGACCTGASCSVVEEADCTGTFTAPGVACEDVSCPLPQGACCQPPDTCIFTNQFDCEGNFGGLFDPTETCDIPNPCAAPFGACCFFDGTCGDDMSEPDCTAMGGAYDGDFSVCAAANCPATGACCLLDSGCLQQENASDCTNLGGISFQGLGTHCFDAVLFPLDPCDDGVLGACCRYDGTCEDGVEKFDCETPLLGQTPGIWQGQGTSCDVQTCDVLGACCEDASTCSDVAIENCNTTFFTWTEGQPCLYDPCAATVGACCVFGECQTLNSFDCQQAGGVFEDVGTNGHRACELAAPCTNGQQGACCLPGGNCEVLTPAQCASSNGVYDGDGVSCASLQCVVGTCCDLGDVCTEERQVDCLGLGSAPGEPGSSCSGTAANPCIPSGACCFDDATCSVLNETILAPQCSSMGGTYQGDGTVCEAIACPEVGACCSELVPDSGFFGCENGVSEPVCLARPLGSFGGFGSDCTGDPCGQGACCALDATCTDTSRLACEVDPLDDFLGNGTSCGVDVCEPRGACCMGTSCQILTQDICSNGAGMYLGDATICETNTCETAPCCVDGQCQDLFPTDCVATNGVQGTLGDACANGDFCTDGACCLGLSCFTAAGLHQLQCESLGGSFVGPGSDCTGDPCAPITVGCCVPGGACQDLTEAGCLGVGGVSLGTDSDCATSNAFCSAEFGACCRPGDVCFADDTPANCAAQSGTFLGVGIDCSGNPCAVIGACCKLDGDCFDSGTQSQCDAIGGATFSSGQTCGAVSCPDVCSNGTLADFDNDGDADLQDYAELQICMGGPTVANPTIDDRCYCAFDVDTNGIFDQSDADVILPLFDGCLPFLSQIAGDFDNDGDVDLIDFASMQVCVASVGVGPDPVACRCIFDDDGNGTVDAADVSRFGTMDGP